MTGFREIELGLAGGIGNPIFFYDNLPSTNDFAKAHLKDFTHGTVIAANLQTAGRGQGDNIWFSPAGKGLYFSIVLKPDNRLEELQLLTLMAALALKRGIEEIAEAQSVQPQVIDIKWPNDLLHNDRKLAGILVEGVFHREKMGIIAGIGLNITDNTAEIPEELKGKITSLEEIYGIIWDSEIVLEYLLRSFSEYYRNFNPEAIVEDYVSSCRIWGRKGTLSTQEKEYRGICRTISRRGELILGMEQGDKTFISGTLRMD